MFAKMIMSPDARPDAPDAARTKAERAAAGLTGKHVYMMQKVAGHGRHSHSQYPSFYCNREFLYKID